MVNSWFSLEQKSINQSGVWGRGCDKAEISEEKPFSLNEGKAFSE